MLKFKFLFFIAMGMIFLSCASKVSSKSSESATNENGLYKPEAIWGVWRLESENGNITPSNFDPIYVFFETGQRMYFNNPVEPDGVQISNEFAMR